MRACERFVVFNWTHYYYNFFSPFHINYQHTHQILMQRFLLHIHICVIVSCFASTSQQQKQFICKYLSLRITLAYIFKRINYLDSFSLNFLYTIAYWPTSSDTHLKHQRNYAVRTDGRDAKQTSETFSSSVLFYCTDLHIRQKYHICTSAHQWWVNLKCR